MIDDIHKDFEFNKIANTMCICNVMFDYPTTSNYEIYDNSFNDLCKDNISIFTISEIDDVYYTRWIDDKNNKINKCVNDKV